MDNTKYMKQCLGILENEQFAKIIDEPTKRIERKI